MAVTAARKVRESSVYYSACARARGSGAYALPRTAARRLPKCTSALGRGEGCEKVIRMTNCANGWRTSRDRPSGP